MKKTGKIVVGGILVLVLVWQHVQATKIGYEVEKSREQVHRLEGRVSAGRLELEKSLAPAQLALTAKMRLGMLPVAPASLRLLGGPASDAQRSNWFAHLVQSWHGFSRVDG